MLTKIIEQLLQRETKIPAAYERMVRFEYRNEPFDYVEHFAKTDNRLPTPEELQNAI